MKPPTLKTMRKLWTPTEEFELRQLYRIKFAKDLADIFNTTEHAVHLKANRLGLRKCQQPRVVLTDEQRIWLRRNFPHISTEICSSILGVSYSTLARMARAMGLKKTEQFMRECHACAGRRSCEIRNRNWHNG